MIEISEYKSSEIETLKNLVMELQDSLKKIEPETVAPGSSVRDSYTDDLLQKVEAQRDQIYLAKDDGKAYGFIAVYVSKDTDENIEYLYISDVVVSENSRGKGIGNALIEEAEHYARGQNLKFIRISSLVLNEGATRLYRNVGFSDYLVTLQKKI